MRQGEWISHANCRVLLARNSEMGFDIVFVWLEFTHQLREREGSKGDSWVVAGELSCLAFIPQRDLSRDWSVLVNRRKQRCVLEQTQEFNVETSNGKRTKAASWDDEISKTRQNGCLHSTVTHVYCFLCVIFAATFSTRGGIFTHAISMNIFRFISVFSFFRSIFVFVLAALFSKRNGETGKKWFNKRLVVFWTGMIAVVGRGCRMGCFFKKNAEFFWQITKSVLEKWLHPWRMPRKMMLERKQ